MSTAPTRLTARFWRSRRSAAVAGILFAVLLLAAMTMLRLALADDSLAALKSGAPQSAIDAPSAPYTP